MYTFLLLLHYVPMLFDDSLVFWRESESESCRCLDFATKNMIVFQVMDLAMPVNKIIQIAGGGH